MAETHIQMRRENKDYSKTFRNCLTPREMTCVLFIANSKMFFLKCLLTQSLIKVSWIQVIIYEMFLKRRSKKLVLFHIKMCSSMNENVFFFIILTSISGIMRNKINCRELIWSFNNIFVPWRVIDFSVFLFHLRNLTWSGVSPSSGISKRRNEWEMT